MLTRLPLRLLATALLLLGACAANAQLLDDVEWRREGQDAVLQITFAVPIQFQRASISRSGDLAQAFYELRPRGDLPSSLAADRRIAPSDGLPGVSISDDPATGLLSRKLVLRFDRPTKFRIRAGRGNCCIDVVVAGAGAAVDARQAAAPPPAAEDRFLITLQRSTDPNLRMEVPVPSELQAFQLFTSRRVVDGRTLYEINLGYFPTRADAERALKILAQRFPQAQVVELTQHPPPAAVAAVREPVPTAPAAPALPAAPAIPTPPVPVAPVVPPGAPAVPPPAAEAAPAPPAAAPAAAAPTSVEIDQRGRVLLAQARAAMDKNDLEQAVGLFNQLLNLPPNVASQEGQELIGMARARLGDVTRARAEFELYLKLYPTGPGSERVKRELEKLAAAGTPQERRIQRAAAPISSFNGSFAQYYYGGKFQTTQEREGTPLQGVPADPAADPISRQSQRQLQSSLDLNYRYRDAGSDWRLVFRDVFTKNFLQTSSFSTRNPNRLNAAYVEYKALPTGFNGRLGRQSPTGDGVLYRFDGARLGYQFTPKIGLNAVAGVPTDELFDSKRRFYGLSLDTQNLGDHFGASLYGIQQTIDGEIDRRAVGTELRYFDPQTNVFGIYDYDTLFRAVNIASLQGTWQTFGNTTTFTFLADRRTAPILTTGNALLQPDTDPADPTGASVIRRTLTEFLRFHSIDFARELAKATTTYVKQGQLGVTVQTSPNLQFGANASLTNVGALPGFDPGGGVTPIPPSPPTGNVHAYSVQMIASNLYSERDSHVVSFSLTSAPDVPFTDATTGTTTTRPGYKGRLVSYNNLSLLFQTLQVEPAIRYYRQDSNNGDQVTRWSPGLRLSWRVARKLSLEGVAEFDRTKTRRLLTSGETGIETTDSVFYFVGYRFDF